MLDKRPLEKALWDLYKQLDEITTVLVSKAEEDHDNVLHTQTDNLSEAKVALLQAMIDLHR